MGFIHFLNENYLGINSVMESILTLLSMTELGIGTSIAFALYKPIDENDHKKVAALMVFYRKVYHIIGIITAVLGLALIPFIHFFTKDVENLTNINVVYLLFLANTVFREFYL